MNFLRYRYKLILPAILLLVLVMIFPLVFSLRMSFFDYILSKPFHRPFVWFQNYKEVLTDTQFHNSVFVTLKFSFIALLFEMIIGFLLAYLLMKIPRFNNLYVSVLMIPMMITPIAIGLIWRLLLHPDLGIVNYLLNLIGVGGKAWLGLKSTALGTIIFVETWRSTPYVMLILYAALLSLPTEPYEAATIDGASELQKIRYLTIPMLRPVLVVVSTLQLIYLFKTYDLVYILTRGGPGISTETLSYFIFRQGFTNVDMGNASAASYLIVVIVSLATTFLFFRLRGRKITR